MTLNKLIKRDKEMKTVHKDNDNLPVFTPAVDILESDDAFRILADMPGVDEKSVDVDLNRNTLTIRGQRVTLEPEEFNLVHREFRIGNYERVFTLGNVIDREGVKAQVKDGVLELHLPKAKELKPRRIPVNAA